MLPAPLLMSVSGGQLRTKHPEWALKYSHHLAMSPLPGLPFKMTGALGAGAKENVGLPQKAWPSFYMWGSHINTESARTKVGPIRDLN